VFSHVLGFPTGGFSHSGGLEAALNVKNVLDKGNQSRSIIASCCLSFNLSLACFKKFRY